MNKYLKRSTIALTVVILIVASLLCLASLDIKTPDVSDLIINRHQPPVQLNGYTTFLEAVSLLTEKTNKCLSFKAGKSVDTNDILKVIESNKPAIALIEKISQCTTFRQPEVSFTNTLSHFSSQRFMSRLLSLKIKYDCIPSGSFEEAIQTGITSLKFSNLHLQDTRCHLDFLTSGSLLSSGFRNVRELATCEGISFEQLKRLAHELDNLYPLDKAYGDFCKGEFLFMGSTFEKAIGGTYLKNEIDLDSSNREIKRTYFPAPVLHPNRTKKMMADDCRARLKTVSDTYAKRRNDLKEEIPQKTWVSMIKPNLFGYILLKVYRRTVDLGFKSNCKLKSELAATRLVVACQQYHRKEAKFPLRLDELVPEYLPEVPVDPFDGKPLRYLPEKAIIYSVGEDLIDSGGAGDVLNATGRPVKKGKDLVYSLVP